MNCGEQRNKSNLPKPLRTKKIETERTAESALLLPCCLLLPPPLSLLVPGAPSNLLQLLTWQQQLLRCIGFSGAYFAYTAAEHVEVA